MLSSCKTVPPCPDLPKQKKKCLARNECAGVTFRPRLPSIHAKEEDEEASVGNERRLVPMGRIFFFFCHRPSYPAERTRGTLFFLPCEKRWRCLIHLRERERVENVTSLPFSIPTRLAQPSSRLETSTAKVPFSSHTHKKKMGISFCSLIM